METMAYNLRTAYKFAQMKLFSFNLRARFGAQQAQNTYIRTYMAIPLLTLHMLSDAVKQKFIHVTCIKYNHFNCLHYGSV